MYELVRVRIWPTLVTLPVLLLGCGTTEPEIAFDDRIQLKNHVGTTSGRLEIRDEPVGIEALRGTPRRGDEIRLTLEAVVNPPELDGHVLQANSVAIEGGIAVVGYNVQGSRHLGAIDVFDVSRPGRPELLSEALFRDTDVNSVAIRGEFVYFATATSDPLFDDPAALEILEHRGGHLVLEGNARLPLKSHAGTGVHATSSRIFTTSGDGGALTVFDAVSRNRLRELDLDDARWVDVRSGRVAVVQGTPGRLALIDAANLDLEQSYPFPGANVPESKSTVELVGDHAFVSAGPAGVKVLDVHSGEIRGNVPRPDPGAIGLDDEDVVTNSVSVDGRLIFISNGGAGVYVARWNGGDDDDDDDDDGDDDDGDDDDGDDDDLLRSTRRGGLDIELAGKLRLADLDSVNHVTYRDGVVIVAAGRGGLKIVRVS